MEIKHSTLIITCMIGLLMNYGNIQGAMSVIVVHIIFIWWLFMEDDLPKTSKKKT